MKRKIIFSMIATILCIMVAVPNVLGVTNEGVVTSSWATTNEGTVAGPIYSGQENRASLSTSLYEADAIGTNGLEEKFTGVGYFPEGIIYRFDVDVEDSSTVGSKLVENPNPDEPDLSLREITWGGSNSRWIGEGIEVYAVNYNGTGEDKLIAYAYNKTAQVRLNEYNKRKNTSLELKQVEGAHIEFTYPIEGNTNVYSTDIYFSEDFEYCEAIKVIDITESLKIYGGDGRNSVDGYDLDAVFGFVVNYDLEYGNETAVAIANTERATNIKKGNSWQSIVMKVNVEDLKENGDITFDIIAGQNYKIGEGTIYLDDEGKVAVKYDFTEYKFAILGEETAKVGIYDELNDMLDKKGKLLGNGKLITQEEVTEGDAYVRIHFDAQIPEYVYGLTEIN